MVNNFIERKIYNKFSVFSALLLRYRKKLSMICSWQMPISSWSDEIVSTLTEDTKQKTTKT